MAVSSPWLFDTLNDWCWPEAAVQISSWVARKEHFGSLIAELTPTGPTANRPNTVKPIAHLLHGYMGSGKTTFARQLEREFGAVRISHDEWMVRLHGWNPSEEHFSEFRAQVENLIWDEATRVVGVGTDVIIDHGFWTLESRDAARDRARSIGAVPKFYEVFCPQEIMRARALDRSKSPKTDSLWIDGAGFDKLFSAFEPMQDDEPRIRVDGTK